MKNIQNSKNDQSRKNLINRALNTIRGKISGIFEPEEVEVTFKSDGNKARYSYTKVSDKQVA